MLTDVSFGSDHCAISFRIAFGEVALLPYRSWKKIDWLEFSAVAGVILDAQPPPPQIFNMDVVEAELEIITGCITQALDRVSPLKWRQDSYALRFQTEEIDVLRQASTDAWRAWLDNKSRANKEAKNQAQYALKKAMQKASSLAWRKYTSEDIDSPEHLACLIRSLAKDPKATFSLFRNQDGSTSTPEQSLESLLSTHFPGSRTTTPNAGAVTDPEVLTATVFIDALSDEYPWLDPPLVKRAFRSFKPMKAPGPDELRPVQLHNLPWPLVCRISNLFKACIKSGYTPLSWRTA